MEGQTLKPGTVGWAVDQLKNGARMRRQGWSSLKAWIAYVPEGMAKYPQHLSDGYPPGPALLMKTSDDEVVQWNCSLADLLADDWEKVGGSNDGGQG